MLVVIQAQQHFGGAEADKRIRLVKSLEETCSEPDYSIRYRDMDLKMQLLKHQKELNIKLFDARQSRVEVHDSF